MVFSSVFFLFYFLPAIVFGYFIVRRELRNTVLLLASLVFYAWGESQNIVVLLLSILINYLSGIGLHYTRGTVRAKLILAVSLLANLGILGFYKYINFGISIVNQLMAWLPAWQAVPGVSVALPIGLSFFTFQGLSYVIDVYRGDTPVQKNPFYIALYISLFPQLIAGPIVRYTDIRREMRERESSLDDIVQGVERFIIGLSKKVMVADVLAAVSDSIFGMSAGSLEWSTAWLGAICYTFQIFFDFSGYSDMAIGIGRIFGFHFPENFNLPYISLSVTEFWRRWHITLSRWFRDYLYIPLGGNRRGNVYFNLLIVFLCTGLWHGAAYSFLLWGLWHGLFLIAERVGKQRGWTLKLPAGLRWLYTALVVILGWVLFRSEDLGYALGYYAAMFRSAPVEYQQYGLAYYLDRQLIFTLTAALAVSLGLPRLTARFLKERTARFPELLPCVRIPCLWLLLLGCMCMIVNGNYSPFIYFRF